MIRIQGGLKLKKPLLQVENLSISYKVEQKIIKAVRNLDFTMNRGETLAIVGESGSGKTATALSLIGLLPENGRVDNGNIYFNGRRLHGQSEKAWQKVRGQKIAMIFQDPMSALNPVLTIGKQMEEVIYLRKGKKQAKATVREECISLLQQVGVTEPHLRLKQYPHQLSGGIRQRVMIAIALASKPDLLIADEPTTALDPIIKKQILQLLAKLQKEWKFSILLITHDLSETAMIAHKVMVMYAGQSVEFGNAKQVLQHPKHPYTESLLLGIPTMKTTKNQKLRTIEGQPPNPENLPAGCSFHPRCPWVTEACKGKEFETMMVGPGKIRCLYSKEERDSRKGIFEEKASCMESRPDRNGMDPILQVKNLSRHFSVGPLLSRKKLKAVDGIDLSVERGEIVAIVGESGSGKTTLWQTIVGIYPPTSGEIYFSGNPIKSRKDYHSFYTKVGFVFQHSMDSLNPRMTIGDSIMEPLKVAKWSKEKQIERLAELLEYVGLPFEKSFVLPHQLSGGQRQRVAIARALALNPELMILDEPVSSLDVSIQAQIINLLKELQEKLHMSMLFISHDLALVKYFAHRVYVMYGGKVVEEASCDELFENPQALYSKQLIAATTPSLSMNENTESGEKGSLQENFANVFS